MFYKLMYKRSLKHYKKNYFSILCIFILSLSMLSFTNTYCDSYNNYYDAVLIPALTKDFTCDIRVSHITSEQAELFFDITNVDMKYVDGNLDFFLLDPTLIEDVHRDIMKIFNTYIFKDDHSLSAPGIHVYYGREINGRPNNDARIGTTVFQVMLSIVGIVSMVMIYLDYINYRAEDIRLLSALGIRKNQLRNLFLGECNILYLISAVIGIPLGGLIAYLFFRMTELVDMSTTNAIYPVFHINIISLLLTALGGYIVIYITFTIVLRKILRIDASYTCLESIIKFDPEKSRTYYLQADRHFDKFFSAILRKRTASGFKAIMLLVSFVIALSVFFVNAVNNSVHMSSSSYRMTLADIAETIANTSLYIMIIVYGFLYSLVIIRVFNKRQIESCSNAIKTLTELGADRYLLYDCFKMFSLRRILTTELAGFVAGYCITAFIFSAGNYYLSMNIILVVINILMALTYYLVYMLSMKKYFWKTIRDITTNTKEG